jgi:hypothetical protein
MTRFVLALCVGLSSAAALLGAEAKRPNILFAFADDWGRYTGAYAKLDGPGTINDVVRTPNFDRVPAGRVVSPSIRVAAMALLLRRAVGQHFWRTGEPSWRCGWNGSQPSFPLLLREAGYHIGETYKVWSPGAPNDGPFGAGKYAYEKAGMRFSILWKLRKWPPKPMVGGQAGPVRRGQQKLRRLPGGTPADHRSAIGLARPTCIASGSKDPARLCGVSKRPTCKASCPPSCPTCRKCEDLADYRRSAGLRRRAGPLIKRLEAIGEPTIRWWWSAAITARLLCTAMQLVRLRIERRWPCVGAGRSAGGSSTIW